MQVEEQPGHKPLKGSTVTKTTVCTDAADYARANTKTVFVAISTVFNTSVTLGPATIFDVEEAALPLAIAQTQARLINNYPQAVFRKYIAGRISTEALPILA